MHQPKDAGMSNQSPSSTEFRPVDDQSSSNNQSKHSMNQDQRSSIVATTMSPNSHQFSVQFGSQRKPTVLGEQKTTTTVLQRSISISNENTTSASKLEIPHRTNIGHENTHSDDSYVQISSSEHCIQRVIQAGACFNEQRQMCEFARVSLFWRPFSTNQIEASVKDLKNLRMLQRGVMISKGDEGKNAREWVLWTRVRMLESGGTERSTKTHGLQPAKRI